MMIEGLCLHAWVLTRVGVRVDRSLLSFKLLARDTEVYRPRQPYTAKTTWFGTRLDVHNTTLCHEYHEGQGWSYSVRVRIRVRVRGSI